MINDVDLDVTNNKDIISLSLSKFTDNIVVNMTYLVKLRLFNLFNIPPIL